MKKKTILITYGYKKREFEYLSLLSGVLEAEGFTVMLKYVNFELYYDIYRYQPDILLLGQVNQAENIALAQYAAKCGTHIVVLNCEGVYKDDGNVLRFGQSINDYVSLLLAWGLRHRTDALKYSDIADDKVVVSGTPKFDAYKKPFKSYFYSLPTYKGQLDSHKKTVCIATSFGSADYTWETLKKTPDNQKLGRALSEKRVNCQKKLRDHFIKLAHDLGKTKHYNIVFRIHPLEQPDYYLRHLDQSRVIFDNTTPAIQLFTTTDLLVHRTSTLATEAWMAGIHSVSYDPINNEDNELSDLATLEVMFKKSAPLQDHITKLLHHKKADPKKLQKSAYLYEWFGYKKTDHRLASIKIAEALKKLKPKTKHSYSHRLVYVYYLLSFLAKTLGYSQVYQIIGLIRGKKYLTFMSENYQDSSETNRKKKFYRQLFTSLEALH